MHRSGREYLLKRIWKDIAAICFVVALVTPVELLATTSWDLQNDYSGQNNPNGPWSYNRKETIAGTAADPMTVQWGTDGWYLGNVGNGGPSIQGGVAFQTSVGQLPIRAHSILSDLSLARIAGALTITSMWW